MAIDVFGFRFLQLHIVIFKFVDMSVEICTIRPMNRIFIAFSFLATALMLPSVVVAQDTDAGEIVWKKCRSCHEVGIGAGNKVGPHLNDIFGRPAAAIGDFRYSKALIDAADEGLIWNAENMDTFLRRPKSFIKKTRMTFSGLKKPEDRANLIAFMQIYSGDDETGARDSHLTANDPDVPADVLMIKGDVEYGEYLSATCVTCHQISGDDKGIPSIIGWPNEAFVTVMYSYRSRFRENDVMRQVAGSLNNEEIAALAAYFETQQAAEE